MCHLWPPSEPEGTVDEREGRPHQPSADPHQ
jgi:hypothetical protein